VSRADEPGCHPVETQKNHLQTACASLAVASKQENWHALFTLTPNLYNLIVTNPVLGKNLEHPFLTR